MYGINYQLIVYMLVVFKIHEIDTESGLLAWLVEYEDISKTIWRNRGKTQDPCRFTVFRVRF